MIPFFSIQSVQSGVEKVRYPNFESTTEKPYQRLYRDVQITHLSGGLWNGKWMVNGVNRVFDSERTAMDHIKRSLDLFKSEVGRNNNLQPYRKPDFIYDFRKNRTYDDKFVMIPEMSWNDANGKIDIPKRAALEHFLDVYPDYFTEDSDWIIIQDAPWWFRQSAGQNATRGTSLAINPQNSDLKDVITVLVGKLLAGESINMQYEMNYEIEYNRDND